MYKLSICLLLLIATLNVLSQKQSRVSIKINKGINGNFFVRNYDEVGGPINKTFFYKKDFIGSTTGIDADFNISPKSSLSLGFLRTINLGKKNYAGNVNGVDVYINDFRLKHIDKIISIGYGYKLKDKNSSWKAEGGLILLYDVKQSISLKNWDNSILINESNFKNANSVEGGIFLGGSWAIQIDTKFELGLQARGYYLISVQTFEMVTLSPTLTYHFAKSKQSFAK